MGIVNSASPCKNATCKNAASFNHDKKVLFFKIFFIGSHCILYISGETVHNPFFEFLKFTQVWKAQDQIYKNEIMSFFI